MQSNEKRYHQKIKVAKSLCLNSLLYFTRYFFKQRHKRKFIVGTHHGVITNALEDVLSGKMNRLIINIAPRYGKTEIAVINFIAHALSINPSALFIHLSGSQDLALNNSEQIRDMINTSEYQELFPEVQIKSDSKSKKKWYTTKGGGVYATAAGGQVTGFGAGKVDDDIEEALTELENKEGFGGAIVIDDPIKPEDAESKIARDKVNNRFDSTIVNRVNSRNTPIIIIMQRLHPNDLCGYLLKKEDNWTVLSLPSIREDGTALWEHKHTIEELREIESNNKVVFERQHMQNPKPIEGLLYSKFLTYDQLGFEVGMVRSYTDTADTGKDCLCSIIYTEHLGMKYLLDVYYTPDKAEITEREVAERHTRFNVNYARVEANSGGRAFARNVERLCREQGNFTTEVQPFHQSKNKEARIQSNSSTVQNTVYYPSDWGTRWRDFYNSMTSFMAKTNEDDEGRDDAQDTITGVVEKQLISSEDWDVDVE